MQIASTLDDMLEYKAPFLIEKLLKEHIVDSATEGEQLFTEVKRWLFLVQKDQTKNWEMYSLRIDEVWHQFILFTGEYMKFCERYFGFYVAHNPSNAPKTIKIDPKPKGSFEDFRKSYEKIFARQITDLWFDERGITLNRRIINKSLDQWIVESDTKMVSLKDPKNKVLISINILALEAITFIANTGAFYVRELPGDLTEDEKIALTVSLVESNLLRIGS